MLAHFQADAEEFLKVATEVNAASPAKVDELDAELMKMFAYNAQGDICPIQAFIGGITAQEVMKVGYFSDTEMGLEVVSKCFVVWFCYQSSVCHLTDTSLCAPLFSVFCKFLLWFHSQASLHISMTLTWYAFAPN